MISEASVFVLEIPNWINKVKIGTIPTLYYSSGDSLPKKYVTDGAVLKRMGNKYYYVDKSGKKIVKNPGKEGTPEYWNMNGQSFYSNNITWRQRFTIVNFYHRYITPYVKEQLKEPFPEFLSYKLDMCITIYDVFSRFTPDITNMWILSKMIEDTVVSCGILRDDSPEFRMRTSFGYEFVDSEEQRKVIVEFKYKKY